MVVSVLNDWLPGIKCAYPSLRKLSNISRTPRCLGVSRAGSMLIERGVRTCLSKLSESAGPGVSRTFTESNARVTHSTGPEDVTANEACVDVVRLGASLSSVMTLGSNG